MFITFMALTAYHEIALQPLPIMVGQILLISGLGFTDYVIFQDTKRNSVSANTSFVTNVGLKYMYNKIYVMTVDKFHKIGVDMC